MHVRVNGKSLSTNIPNNEGIKAYEAYEIHTTKTVGKKEIITFFEFNTNPE